jgi:hypothetical protein
MRMHASGASLASIRVAIERTYGTTGYKTPTPPVLMTP